MEKAIAAKVFGKGGVMELKEEVISYSDGSAHHHKGVKHTVFGGSAPQTLVDLFRIPMLRGFMDREFLVFGEERLTFGEAYEQAGNLGHALVNDYNVQRGDRVTICARNYPEYILAFLAITSIGAVAVPMNSWWTTQELEYGISHSGSKIVVCDKERLDRILPLLEKIPTLEKVLLVREPDHQVPHHKVEHFHHAIAKGKGKEMPDFPCEKDENAILMYTSGTTGFPKGVVMTHRGVSHALNGAISLAMVGKLISAMKAKGTAQGEKEEQQQATLLVVPLFHATGLHAIFLISILIGRKLVLMRKWDAEEALRLIEQEKITQFTGVPTMVLEVMQHPKFAEYDTSSLASIGGGGAPPPPSMVRDVGKKFKKASPTQGYGMTETNAFVCINAAENYVSRPTSCGRPVPGVVVEIWDEQNNKLPPQTPGRIMIKGANIMKEYWRNPEATAKAITPDGFLDSGDIGKLDEEGFLYIMDRAKDIVIRGGENISCAEVEAAVYENENVSEAAVIGVKHPTLQEEVGVAIFPKPGKEGQITLESVRATCSNLAQFKKPAHVFLYKEQLPRGATGKILKTKIREDILNGTVISLAPTSKL